MTVNIRGFDILIDDEDLPIIEKHRWKSKQSNDDIESGRVYFFRSTEKNGRKIIYYLHRVLSCTPKGLICDHINRNTRDCRKSNLRNVTNSISTQNCKIRKDSFQPYKGVSIRNSGWRYRIRTPLGRLEKAGFKTPELAHEEYRRLALEHYGPNAAY